MASDGDGLILGEASLSLAGALSVARSGAVTSIGTIVDGDTLSLKAAHITADGPVQVNSLSSASGILNVGTGDSNVSGISVGGSASGLSTAFLWHAASPKSHWELVGGDLRVTRVRSDEGRVVSYTLCIADDDAFEIHQSTSNTTGSGSHRRVARFGMT